MQFLTTALIPSEVSEVAEGLCNIQGQFQLSKHHLHSVPCVCSLCNVEVQSEPLRAPTFLVFPSSHSYIAMGILLCFPNGSCFCKVDCLQKSGFNIHYVWIWSYELRLLFFFFSHQSACFTCRKFTGCTLLFMCNTIIIHSRKLGK